MRRERPENAVTWAPLRRPATAPTVRGEEYRQGSREGRRSPAPPGPPEAAGTRPGRVRSSQAGGGALGPLTLIARRQAFSVRPSVRLSLRLKSQRPKRRKPGPCRAGRINQEPGRGELGTGQLGPPVQPTAAPHSPAAPIHGAGSSASQAAAVTRRQVPANVAVRRKGTAHGKHVAGPGTQ